MKNQPSDGLMQAGKQFRSALSCAIVACMGSAALAGEQAPGLTGRIIDPYTIPAQTESRPLSDADRANLLSKGLIEPGDSSVREVIGSHVMPDRDHSWEPMNRIAPSAGGPGSGLPNLNYGNGQVLTSPIIIPVFWGFKASAQKPNPALDPDGVVPYALNFIDSLAVSPWLATLHQYYNGGASQPVVPRSLVVTSPIFDDSTSPGSSYDNGSVASEVGRITAQYGNNSNEIVVVFTPHGSVNQDMVTQGACAEHFSSQGLNWFNVVHNYTFVTMPYNPDQQGCGSGYVGNVLDGVSIVLGHEIAETITDPYSGFAWNIGHETGWVASDGEEIGDLCAWQDLMRTPIDGSLVATQPLWSNQAQNCIQMTAALKTYTGNYVTAVNGGGLGGYYTALQTNRTVASTWETFTLDWDNSSRTTFSLKTQDGTFVTAVNGGGIGGPNSGQAPVHTDAVSIGPWEQFELTASTCTNSAPVYAPNTCITIQAQNGDFVTAVNGGGFGGPNTVPIHTDATQAGMWETMTMMTP